MVEQAPPISEHAPKAAVVNPAAGSVDETRPLITRQRGDLSPFESRVIASTALCGNPLTQSRLCFRN